jgi:alpha-mannosidase
VHRATPILAVAVTLLAASSAAAGEGGDVEDWTVYVTNDNCPDYTWGFTEEQTRQAFADVVGGHLDEMTRTDAQPPECRDRYNAAVTQEVLCFLERYPDRKNELLRRIREGRLYVSPYLCNSLWGFQGIEGAIRTFYPARRLERACGIRGFDVAEHIEEPSLPWGVATILAGCGVRWLSNPFYKYDSTFDRLKTPPLFIHEGPDGSRLRVVMDPWACNRASYMQGRKLLNEPKAITGQWIPHYRGLGEVYPLRFFLASGTHGDINPGSGSQARGIAEKIIRYNAAPGPHPTLVNATLPMFCEAVDAAEKQRPFLPVVRGSFGHAWDVWPVCLARYATDMREGARRFLAAEALLAACGSEDVWDPTRADRRRAEWCWAMLSDHAWNGTNEANKRHNAELRRDWAHELGFIARDVRDKTWRAGARPAKNSHLTVFNPLSVLRQGLVSLEPPGDLAEVCTPDGYLPTQVETDDGGRRKLAFASPPMDGFASVAFDLEPPRPRPKPAKPDKLRATPTELEGPFYRLTVDPKTGGIASLIHKATGAELVIPGKRTLCQTVYHDGAEHTLTNVTSHVVAEGPVSARLKVTGTAAGIRITNDVTVYADLDRVDFVVRIDKPVTTKRERLCQVFPVVREGAVLRVETTGAVIRPYPQPEGDLVPGADTRRFAVQGFVDASLPDGPGVTIATPDAFVLRQDLGPVTLEALGNDQNYREVVQDQNGEKAFRFRYGLRAHAGPYDGAEAVAWSRSVAQPCIVSMGQLKDPGRRPPVTVDPTRAIATCLKPADDPGEGGVILRLRETAGRAGPLRIPLRGFTRAVRTDLLERDLEPLAVTDGAVTVDLRPHGLASVRLVP